MNICIESKLLTTGEMGGLKHFLSEINFTCKYLLFIYLFIFISKTQKLTPSALSMGHWSYNKVESVFEI